MTFENADKQSKVTCFFCYCLKIISLEREKLLISKNQTLHSNVYFEQERFNMTQYDSFNSDIDMWECVL